MTLHTCSACVWPQKPLNTCHVSLNLSTISKKKYKFYQEVVSKDLYSINHRVKWIRGTRLAAMAVKSWSRDMSYEVFGMNLTGVGTNGGKHKILHHWCYHTEQMGSKRQVNAWNVKLAEHCQCIVETGIISVRCDDIACMQHHLCDKL